MISRSFAKANFGPSLPDLSDAPANILPYTEDRYDGVIIQSEKLPITEQAFTEALKDSLSYWKMKQRRGIWLKIPIQYSHYIPIAVANGFQFHHAENSYLMLTNWLSNQSSSRLPLNASHQVGVGCVVINKQGKILLVQERNGPLKNTQIWKLPTGK
jgi:hypothetical protein